MKIRKGKKQGQYEVESSREKGRFYIVDTNKGSCSCPYWLFHLVKTGDKCKHIIAVEKKYSVKVKKREHYVSDAKEKAKPMKTSKTHETKLAKALDYIKSKGEASSVELIDKFGEKTINLLIERGEILEQKGRIILI